MSMAESRRLSDMPQKIVIMGVAGCGKSSVGAALAEALGATYRDGDRFHPEENIRKMSAGIPLEDADRWPWLDRIGHELGNEPGQLIIGCSALKRRYRDRIRSVSGEPVLFIHLQGPKALIAERMASRDGHFMPLSLLDSQFAALEPPAPDEWSLVVSIDQDFKGLVDGLADRIRAEVE